MPMEEERCPLCKYSLKRTSTNLIQFRGQTVLLGETCSRWALLLSVHQLSEKSTSLNATRHEIYRNWRNPPPLKSLPQPTRTWHCTCREPICKCCHGRWRTSLTLQMYNWLIMDGKLRNMSTWCLPFFGSQLHHRNSWTSSGVAAKRRAKSVVEGVAMGPMECRALATVSAKEACLL